MKWNNAIIEYLDDSNITQADITDTTVFLYQNLIDKWFNGKSARKPKQFGLVKEKKSIEGKLSRRSAKKPKNIKTVVERILRSTTECIREKKL